MRITSVVLFVLATIALPASSTAQTSVPTISLDEIHPGMQGYGLTVFQGTEPERFDVEVIGVNRNFLPHQDIILIRCHHPVLEHTGIVAGMSGSPIYFQGKLAGALAYGWHYAKDPIAGVTPIQYMLPEIERPLRGMPRGLMGPTLARQANGPSDRAPARSWRDSISTPDQYFTRFDRDRELSPLATPLFLSGFSRRARELMADLFEPYGIVPLQTGGGGHTTKRPVTRGGPNPFVAGGGIGVQLVRGDIDSTSIGTITYVDRNKFLAFGHPMLNTGEQYLPVTTARIHTFIASFDRSFKIGEPIEEVGSLTQDRQACIGGDVTRRARMIPVTIHMTDTPSGGVHSGTTRREDTFNIEIAENKFLTPGLAFGAAFDAISEGLQDQADATLTIHGRIGITDFGTIDLTDYAFTTGGASDPGALGQARFFDAMNSVMLNPFQEASFDRMDLDIDVRYERGVSEIRSVFVTSDELTVGERINVGVVLRPLGGADEVRSFPFVVPREAAGRDLEIEVATGSEVRPETAEPQNLRDLIHNVTIAYPATSIVISLKLPGEGVTLTGHVVRALPNSALDTLRPAASTASATTFTTTSRQVLPMDRVIWGSERLRVRVRDLND